VVDGGVLLVVVGGEKIVDGLPCDTTCSGMGSVGSIASSREVERRLETEGRLG
jgi:hypothetical protein